MGLPETAREHALDTCTMGHDRKMEKTPEPQIQNLLVRIDWEGVWDLETHFEPLLLFVCIP